MNPADLIDHQISDLTDWRGQMFARLRTLIHEADSTLTEEWKWGTAGWSSNGMVCSMGAFKDHLKVNFFKGASLLDPHGLFNSGLDAKVSRSIDFAEGDSIHEQAFKELIRAAVAFNKSH